jgi:phage/plasmid primase-like uncharacterized protein
MTDKRLAEAAQKPGPRKRTELKTLIYKRVMRKLTESWEADDNHPYLRDNAVKSHDLSVDAQGNLLAVGVDLKASFTPTGYIPKAQTMLTITPYGVSRLEKWAVSFGAAVMIGHQEFRQIAKVASDNHVIFVAEDYATGAFLYESFDAPVTVALRPSTVKSVVRVLRAKFPKARIIVCLNSPEGREKIRQRTARDAEKYGAIVLFPEFSRRERENGLISFNDRAMFTRPGSVQEAIIGQVQKCVERLRLQEIERENELQRLCGNCETQLAAA